MGNILKTCRRVQLDSLDDDCFRESRMVVEIQDEGYDVMVQTDGVEEALCS